MRELLDCRPSIYVCLSFSLSLCVCVWYIGCCVSSVRTYMYVLYVYNAFFIPVESMQGLGAGSLVRVFSIGFNYTYMTLYQNIHKKHKCGIE